MQEINWATFKVKFNKKEQSSFEWLCYLLFCKEFKKPTGIPRYKNQAGIETNPFESKGDIVGWQAKFYETRLSDHKKDFLKSIDTTKNRYPNINKIIFYTNQDFGQDKKKTDPKFKIEIERYAKSKNLEIVWRTSSFFESPFVCEENFNIARHFFSFDKSLIDLIGELTLNTENILETIHSKIIYDNFEIKIDRSQVVEKLKEMLFTSTIIILSGEGGVGKTAIIKDFYDLEKIIKSFFVFKASEFNISNVNQFFKNYGTFSLSDFIKAQEDFNNKLLVIDSAEKLSEIKHPEVFQEFLSALLENNWKIIFTTRLSYLDDLRNQFVEVYRLNFQSINIENITKNELERFSKTYNFNLPINDRLQEILLNPFYLNEYIQNYKSIDRTISYSDFKNILWNKKISKSSYRQNNTHIKRENCFIKIAQKRANEGLYSIIAEECDNEILQKLESDEIIKYDSNTGGYFITHDIYEEWALDKIIERAFHQAVDYKNFFEEIGSSLPIRKAFRNWLSEKLFVKKEDVKILIEVTIKDYDIKSYWKDEIIVSVLLSDYSEIFFQLFESKLLEDNQKLLLRTIFLLRIACKEIDENVLNLLGISRIEGIALKTLFTRPKGRGWSCVIDFINKYKEEFGSRHLNKILPMLDDWNNKNKHGQTTKNASQIALFYYDKIVGNGGFRYGSRDETINRITRIILNGSYEIKEELKNIINEVILKKEIDHRGRNYELIRTILSTATDSFEIAINLPEQVIRLADLFWFQIHDDTNWHSHDRIGVEQFFCLPQHYHNYFPASALQTPILQLLRFAPSQTINFILSFTNKTVDCYSKSKLKNEIEEVDVFIDETKTIKQYISSRLWNMYRGTQGSTHLLESIHMALEKWLLEIAKTTSKEILENWCEYLIENSKSASITAVVTSVVLAYPSKLFNIAKILFQTKKFILYDTGRMILEQGIESLYSIGYGINYLDRIHQDERIQTCNDKHRKMSLEHLAVNYQFFRSKEESEQETQRRQEIIWNILDKYYKQLPDKSKETSSDKTWRLYLARMDRRKMKPTTEEQDGQILINLNPEIDIELKKYSEEAIKKSTDEMKYSSLKLWSHYRFERNVDKYKLYQQYENSPQFVIKETKEIIKGIEDKRNGNFSSLNQSIPAYTCSVLISDFFDKLNRKEREFCKEVIIKYASVPLHSEHYFYQISDGTEPSFLTLPQLISFFPTEKEKPKLLSFLLLLSSSWEISKFIIRGIFYNLWEKGFEDAHSIFLGYLLLKPQYDDIKDKIRNESYKNSVHEPLKAKVLDQFEIKYKNEIERIISNNVAFDELPNLGDLDLDTLTTAFELLPLKTENEDHKKFLSLIFPIFSKKIFIDTDRTDYSLKYRFLKKFVYFILTSNKEEIEIFLKSFIHDFSISEGMADFFSEFVSAEDKLNEYEAFWIVWNAFYTKIVEMCKNKSEHYFTKKIIFNYLLALPNWSEEAKEWHTLRDREKLFFKKIADDIGHHPSVFYSLSKLLNDIGSTFIEDGVFWISNILQKNQNLSDVELETNTIYYIENIVRRYILNNRQKVKTSIQIKKQIIVILNFLIEKGSVTGYLLREEIL